MRSVMLGIIIGLVSCAVDESVAKLDDSPSLGKPKKQTSISACSQDPRVLLGLASIDVCIGAELFFREPFGGNGRTCATCHPAAHNFTVDPLFIASLPPADPLFIAENNAVLSQLEMPALMRQFGLILENLDGTTSPTTKFVMRSVPHMFALATSVTAPPLPTPDGTTRPPNQRTGWAGDGAPNAGELRDFQTGAVIQHYTKSLNRAEGVDFVLPVASELEAILTFVATIGRTNDIDLTSASLTDSGAELGRLTYLDPIKRCNGCHRNAGANVAAGFNRNFNTGVENARLPDLNSLGIPRDGGFGGQNLPNFDHDSDGDGVLDSFGNGTFNTPPLIEAADTAPFFHTNAFTTLESAIGFYTTRAFAQSASGNGNPIPLTSADISNIGRFLRVVNAAMNCQLALARIDGLVLIIDDQKNHNADMQRTLAQLALNEVSDALADLTGVTSLNASAQMLLQSALVDLQTAATHASHTQRLRGAQSARDSISAANSSLGNGMTFVMGAGSFMF